ncbi:DUF1730 domain-containing protein [Kamptonema cortianum]|nr:DUF1730 domain-containing protein [Kamptonema cortianum]
MLSGDPIKAKATALGFDSVGVCSPAPPVSLDVFDRWLQADFHGEMAYLRRYRDIRGDLSKLLPGVQSVIVVGLNYYQEESRDAASAQARIARYALGRDYHKVIRGKLRALARQLGESHPEAQFRACVDSAPILEREYAQRAGLGWFGKNTCLIDSKRGSWFLIGSLLTTLLIERDDPAIGGLRNLPRLHRCLSHWCNCAA